MENYVKLMERVSQAAGISVEEIERKVEAKRAKLSGLVSKEGAAQIVAAELGVHLDREKLKIAQLVQGMKRANVVGKVVEIFPVRKYERNGKENKVGRFLLADESSNLVVVLWDTHHIALLEEGKIVQGSVVEILHASVRNGELHTSSFSDVKLSNEKIENVVIERVFAERTIAGAEAGQRLKARAVVVQVFEPRYFEVCGECGKRVLEGECKVHGKVEGKKRAVVTLVLDDGTQTVRAALFGEHIQKVGLSEEEVFSLEKFAEKKQALLGEEKYFSGTLRNNALYNTLEFSLEQVEDVNVDVLLKELEKT